jgi:hypothetical protein
MLINMMSFYSINNSFAIKYRLEFALLNRFHRHSPQRLPTLIYFCVFRAGFQQKRTIMEKQPPRKLLDRVCDVALRKHYSIRTEGTYVNWMQARL